MRHSRWTKRARREEALEELLLDLFTTSELRRLVQHEFGDRVHACVSWSQPQAAVVSELVRRLKQRGLIPQLLDVLVREREERRADIETVCELFSTVPAHPLPQPPQPRRAGVPFAKAAALLLTLVASGVGLTNILTSDDAPSDGATAEPDALQETALGEKPESPSKTCCKVCGSATSQACGDSCIPKDKTCTKDTGCACS
ncbi:MAG: hypothetical protein R3A79_02445 [Nannocystaceae bacterium]